MCNSIYGSGSLLEAHIEAQPTTKYVSARKRARLTCLNALCICGGAVDVRRKTTLIKLYIIIIILIKCVLFSSHFNLLDGVCFASFYVGYVHNLLLEQMLIFLHLVALDNFI